MRSIQIIFCILIFLCGQFNLVYGTILPSDISKFPIIGNGTQIDSFDFSIEKIEYDGMLLGSITTLRKYDGTSTMFTNGGQLLYTHNGIHVNVTAGDVALGFRGDNGLVISFASRAGNSFEFEPESFSIVASAANTNDVLVQFDGGEYYIPPGRRTQIVDFDIISETDSPNFAPNIRGTTPVVIFGSAHLDVSTIDIGSLCIEGLDMKVRGKVNNLSAIVAVDDDEYPDLIVMFEDISDFLYNGVGYATLKGILSDGTIINGRAGILVLPYPVSQHQFQSDSPN